MTALVTWVWQGLAIAAIAALLVRTIPHLNAATRHMIWWSALVMVLIHPWAAAAVRSVLWQGPLAPPASAAPGPVATTLLLPAPPEWLIVAALTVWGGMVAFSLSRIIVAIVSVFRLKGRSRPLELPRQDRLPLWTSIRRSGRQPELRVSDLTASPCALGLGKPVILIPAALASTLSDRDLDLIVLHEHAHLARYDDWLRLLQCGLAAIAGIHPAVRLITRQIDLEREAACDDCVVLRSGDPRSYARCLATVAGMTGRVNRAALAVVPNAVRPGSVLRARVTRLLNGRRSCSATLAPSATVASLAAMVIAVIGSSFMPALVVIHDAARQVEVVLHDSLPVPAAILSQMAPGLVQAAGVILQPAPEPELVLPAPIVDSVPRPASVRSVPATASNAVEPEPVQPPPIDSRATTAALGPLSVSSRIGNPEDPAPAGIAWGARFAAPGMAAGDDARRVGVSVGASSRRAGVSIGRFFSRAGKSVAAEFTEPRVDSRPAISR